MGKEVVKYADKNQIDILLSNTINRTFTCLRSQKRQIKPRRQRKINNKSNQKLISIEKHIKGRGNSWKKKKKTLKKHKNS